MIANVANDWAAFDPQDAIKWANNLPEGPEKELGFEDIFESWADQDPLAAAQFALQVPSGNMHLRATAAVAERWGTMDPVQTANWVAKLDSESQQEATRRLLRFWAVQSPMEAGQWVKSMPAGQNRENAIESYVGAAIEWAPDLAAQQAITLVNEIVRYQKVQDCVRRWIQLDPAAAKKWVKEANLPPDVKIQCLVPISVF